MAEMSLQPTAEAGNLLQGSVQNELHKRKIEDDEATQGAAIAAGPISSGFDFASNMMKNKATLMGKQLEMEGHLAREQIKMQGEQDLEAQKATHKKAEIDYRDFFTMTPELADGLFKTSNGRLDFRKNIGQRYQTKVVIPLAQLYGRQIEKTLGGGGKGGSQKDLNALKAFAKQYEDTQKEYSGMNLQLKQGIAARNPTVKKQVEEKLKFLQDGKGKYEEAINKIGSMGGLDPDDSSADDASSSPPATSSSDEDALIDKAFQ